ncbi:helix-turn-helix transcriptional regulator [Bacillus atrophaeus]|uniref:helix-turn-helix transcriptional regulator n=1 Tax=Bacillus atrophaeus TaxID=1452 RepID=UPI001C63DE29|nr:helix-turn-helix transcriptional regulator [Bacillus atrophaeus]
MRKLENVRERKLLSDIRKSIGSQQIVADDLNISRQYLSALENGGRNPTVKLMVKMSKYFKVSEKELFPDLFFEIKCNNSLQESYTA